MSGTAKTTAQLYTELPDNVTGAVVPQDLRDVVASGPQWDAVSSAAAPGILRGTVELTDYVTRNGGVVGAGQILATRQTNATQVQNAFNYAATNSKFLQFNPAIIEIDNTPGITTAASNFNSFRLYGEKATSSLRQFHTGAPVLSLGPSDGTANANLVIDGLGLQYSGASTTGGTVLQINYIYLSNVANIDIQGNSAVDNLITAGSAANIIAPFSNIFTNIGGALCNKSFLQFDATSTGSVWANCYFQNSANALSAAAISFGSIAGSAPNEMTFEQLNVEHASLSNCMFFNGGSATFLGCHWEDIRMTGFNPVFWRLANPTKCNISIIGGATVDFGLNSSLMTGTATFFSFFEDCIVSMRAHNFITLGSPSVVRNMPLQMYTAPDGLTPAGVTRAVCKIDDTRFDAGYAGFMSLDTALPRATYGDFELVDGYRGTSVFSRIGGRIVVDDPPTATVIYGALGSDIIVRYKNPIAGNITLTLATLLISGGTLNRPALDQVRVIRESTCTGSFTITVRNAALSTIGVAFTTSSAGTSQVYVHTTTPGTWTQTV